MYKQGVILELRKKEAIIFNDAGEYEKIERIEGMFVGQLVDYKKTRSKHKNKILSAMSVAAVLVAIFFSFSVLKNFRNEVFAYVTLDINPSLEFSINDKNCVVGLKPLNLEAEKITKGLSVKGKDIGLALIDVMDELEGLGYFDLESENIVILSTSASELWDEDDKRNIQINETVASLEEIVRDCTKNHAHIETISATPELRSLSIKSDMSLGRYALYTKALEEGKDISLQDAKTAPLSQLINSQEYSSSNPDKTSTGNDNADELLNSGAAASNKNSGERKEGLPASQNMNTDTLGSNADDEETDTLTHDEEGTKKVLPHTMPGVDEVRQLPEERPALPSHNGERPSTKPQISVSEPRGEEPKPLPHENTEGEMRETLGPSPAKPPILGKPDNGPEGEKPGFGFGMPGGNIEKGRPFIDDDFMKRPDPEDGKEGDEELQREPDRPLPDKGEDAPDSIPGFTPGHGKKTRQRQQSADGTP